MTLILSGTDGLSDVDGSAATPAIRGTDTNTGIFFPAADTIAFSEGGVEAARFDANGGLQIGRTSVIGTNNRLAVQMAGTSASGYTAATNAAIAIDAGTATNSVINLVGGGDLGIFRTNSSAAYDVGISFGNNTDRIIRFDTAGAERARISSAGGFMVGTTTDPGAGLISDSAGNVRAIPSAGAAKTGSYTLVKADVGDFVEIGSGGSITVPTSVFAAGDAVALFNNTTGNITITCSAPTAYVSGTNTVRTSLTLATRGLCNILFITPTLCVITGNVT